MDEVLQTPLEVWTGLVRTQGASTVLCLAHRQHAMLQGIEFEKDRLVALYNMKKVFENSATWCLQWQTDSIYVFIPEENEVIPWCVKEVCAGMGGIGQGLEAIGFNRVAALDCNPLMCDTLKQNGIPGVILGDVLVATDSAALHQTPQPMRCLVASGFPCQPLSSQGDMKGQADCRSTMLSTFAGEREGSPQCQLHSGGHTAFSLEPQHGLCPDHPQPGPLMALPKDEMVGPP